MSDVGGPFEKMQTASHIYSVLDPSVCEGYVRVVINCRPIFLALASGNDTAAASKLRLSFQ